MFGLNGDPLNEGDMVIIQGSNNFIISRFIHEVYGLPMFYHNNHYLTIDTHMIVKYPDDDRALLKLVADDFPICAPGSESSIDDWLGNPLSEGDHVMFYSWSKYKLIYAIDTIRLICNETQVRIAIKPAVDTGNFDNHYIISNSSALLKLRKTHA